jgi:hypothetical protein
MPSPSFDNLLTDGWEIAGYAVTMMAAGAMTHSLLMRKGKNLRSVTVVVQGDREIGRTSVNL